MTDHSDLIERLRRTPDRNALTQNTCQAQNSLLIDAASALSSQSLSLSEAREALRHYADTFCELGTDHECCGKLNDDQCSGCRARKVLESGPAGLADAHTNPADTDLSSLRKGAEVVGEAAAYDFVAGWHGRQAKLFREMAEDDPRTAEPQRKRAFEAAIHHAASAAALRNRAADDRRAALVSGSREDGDG